MQVQWMKLNVQALYARTVSKYFIKNVLTKGVDCVKLSALLRATE